jgi:hypothetical protein
MARTTAITPLVPRVESRMISSIRSRDAVAEQAVGGIGDAVEVQAAGDSDQPDHRHNGRHFPTEQSIGNRNPAAAGRATSRPTSGIHFIPCTKRSAVNSTATGIGYRVMNWIIRMSAFIPAFLTRP